MRIGGLASGMDTEQMIRDLMRAERIRIDRLLQQEQRIKWRQEAYNDINRKMANFILNTRKVFSGSERAITKGTVERFDWVKSVTSSHENVIKATASTGAMNGTHTIRVKSLAEVARVTSEKLSDSIENGKFKETGTFELHTFAGKTEIKISNASVTSDDFVKFDFSGEEALTFSINGHLVQLNGDYGNAEGVSDEIQVQLDKEFDRLKFDPDDPRRITVSFEGDKIKFESRNSIAFSESGQGKLNEIGLKSGVTEATNTIQSLINQLNNATNAEGKSLGIRAAYDSSLDQIMITTKNSGKSEFIKFTDFTGIDKNKFFTGDSVDPEGKGAEGSNAEIIFNGDTLTNITTNNFTIYGINIQLQSALLDTDVRINVDSNVDGIYKKVEEFISDYNQMIDDVNGLIGQKFYRDFAPLSQEQKKSMSDDEVKIWEEKSKSGLLKQDEGLTRILQNMRMSIYNEVKDTTGQYNHITNIGITTGTYQGGGKLVIDEEKLRAAIANDPEGVVNLLFKTSDVVVPTDGSPEAIRAAKQRKDSETGIIQRIYDEMITGMKDVIRRSGHGADASLYRTVQSNMLIDFVTNNGSISVIDKDLTSINSRIAQEERILASREDRYWRQFSAMEKAMNQMQQQSMWLMNQLGMGQ